jgi:photosystem II oxygen-evolving enhancer protein 2
MLRKILVTLLAILSLTLASCSSSIGVSGLQRYDVPEKGYQFLYPNGWLPVDIKNASTGVDVVYHDLIERTENLSVIVNPVAANKTLADLGTPSDIGYRFLKQINNVPNLGERHNIASVAVSRGKLYTFNVSTEQKRWGKKKDLFEFVTQSFSVY